MGFLIKKTMTAYSEKLKNPKWQRKRLEVLNRDNFTCQHCRDTKTELHVHHLKYKKEPYNADLEDLVTLCKDCHAIETFFNFKSPPISYTKIQKAMIIKSESEDIYFFSLKNDKPEVLIAFGKNSSVLKTLYELSL